MRVNGKALLLLVVILLSGCSSSKKEIKFTYSQSGTVSISELEGVRRDFRGKGVLLEEPPEISLESTMEEILRHIESQDIGSWELVEDADYMKNIDQLAESVFGSDSYVTEEFKDGLVANRLIGTDYFVRLAYTSDYHYYVIGLDAGVEIQ